MPMRTGLSAAKVGSESTDSARAPRSASFFIWNSFEGDSIDWQEK